MPNVLRAELLPQHLNSKVLGGGAGGEDRADVKVGVIHRRATLTLAGVTVVRHLWHRRPATRSDECQQLPARCSFATLMLLVHHDSIQL